MTTNNNDLGIKNLNIGTTFDVDLPITAYIPARDEWRSGAGNAAWKGACVHTHRMKFDHRLIEHNRNPETGEASEWIEKLEVTITGSVSWDNDNVHSSAFQPKSMQTDYELMGHVQQGYSDGLFILSADPIYWYHSILMQEDFFDKIETAAHEVFMKLSDSEVFKGNGDGNWTCSGGRFDCPRDKSGKPSGNGFTITFELTRQSKSMLS